MDERAINSSVIFPELCYNDTSERNRPMTAVQTSCDTKAARFNVVVQKEEAWYVAVCVDNSVASQGKTVEEALDNLKEALKLYYEDEPLYTLPVPALLTSVEVAV
jgi:predicted RNase H-like HicB family nuclease